MRKINFNEFKDYTIAGDGWNCNFANFKDALREFNNINSGTLYGNRFDGSRAIIDLKNTKIEVHHDNCRRIVF